MKCLFCLTAALCASSAFSSVTLFDFETEDERRQVPNIRTSDGTVIAVTNSMAPSGSWAIHATKRVWAEGMSDRAGVRFSLRPKMTDWRGYDRIVIDVFNDGPSGDWLYVRAVGPSDDWENGLRGRIALAAHCHMRWVVPLDWPKGFDASCVTRMLFNTSSCPAGFDLRLDGIRLLKPGETPPVPVGELFSNCLVPRYERRIADLEQQLAEANGARRHDLAVARFINVCEKGGTRFKGICVGKASSSEQIMPRDDFNARAADSLAIRLARNEWEAMQIVVMPDGSDLKNVRLSVSDLASDDGCAFSASNVQVEVVGYVRTSQPCYPVKAIGWWPDPLLRFMDGVDVKDRDVQSFYLRVRCPKAQPPGRYHGYVGVSAEGMSAIRLPFTVRVNSFEIPDGPPLPLMVSFRPTAAKRCFSDDEYRKLTKDPNAPINIWRRRDGEWTGFLADYMIAREHLYVRQPWAPDFNVLLRLKEEGRLGYFNLGCWQPFGSGAQAAAEWRQTHLPVMRRSYEKAKSLGLLKWACFYGADEVHPGSFKNVAAAAAEIKDAFPDVPIATTAFDTKYGIDGSPLSDITWFVPKVASFDPEQAKRARAAGKKVWWYTCDIPLPPYPTSYIETPVLVTRLLMGAMTAKYRPDGYLYYSISHWNAKRPITSGPFTDWTALSLPPDYNGDGCWVCVGPGGIPLSTLRLENFRDGLEDLAYVKQLESFGEGVTVPEDVVKSVTEYTLNPDVLHSWRDSIADRIDYILKEK